MVARIEVDLSADARRKKNMLSNTDIERYDRQIRSQFLGREGQARLKQSHVVVAGAGGLGCPAATYLACAGVGHITIIDDGLVELTNLNRQFLHWDEDIGQQKAASATAKLVRLNPAIQITPVARRITRSNARRLIKGARVVIDAMDNFQARAIINRACVAEQIPLIHGGVWGLCGQVTTIVPGVTPCLACIYPRRPQSQSIFPVLGVTPGMIATIQAVEAIKIIAGFGRTLAGRMLLINEATMDFAFRELTRNPACPVCKGLRKETSL